MSFHHYRHMVNQAVHVWRDYYFLAVPWTTSGHGHHFFSPTHCLHKIGMMSKIVINSVLLLWLAICIIKSVNSTFRKCSNICLRLVLYKQTITFLLLTFASNVLISSSVMPSMLLTPTALWNSKVKPKHYFYSGLPWCKKLLLFSLFQGCYFLLLCCHLV